MPTKINSKLISWASELEEEALEQAQRTSQLPFIHGHVALMPDAHWGMGATVGSVIPTKGAIVPAAVGVDIGCGMIAAETNITGYDLPEDLTPLLSAIEQSIPAGVGQGHEEDQRLGPLAESAPNLSHKEWDRARKQLGSLGSGNHFVEVCLDEDEHVWLVLHSGSRGIGNLLARTHIEGAKGLMQKYFIELDDPDLAYFVEGTPEFNSYIEAMLWAQDYALANRETMMDALIDDVQNFMGSFPVQVIERINCHHNFTERENHKGVNLWVTRKGAIRAREGDRGVIPGSMGTRSYIVSGLGSDSSYHSCSHGAGRRMSRGRARRELDVDSFRESMKGVAWLDGQAEKLLDEDPRSYKDIDQVMEDQKDLVRIDHTLRQILNYKGV